MPVGAEVQNCLEVSRKTQIGPEIRHPRMGRSLIDLKLDTANSLHVRMTLGRIGGIPVALANPHLEWKIAQLALVTGPNRGDDGFESSKPRSLWE
jgi:hypothetical protein